MLSYREIVQAHKLEKENLLQKKFIEREGLEKAKKFLPSPLIKVIMGPRRAGKSSFALHLLKDLPFAYINFDDNNLKNLKDFDKLFSSILEVYGPVSHFLFDEIQNVPDWELIVNRLHRRGHHLILTGSNSHLLSGELATHLTGRYQAWQVLPFSFSEFIKAWEPATSFPLDGQKNQEFTNYYLTHYLRLGGYPEVVLQNKDQIDKKDYLSTLFESILFKDITKRHQVRYPAKLSELGFYALSQYGTQLSPGKLQKTLGFTSNHTLENYLHYLNQAYLVFFVPRYSHKLKVTLQSPKKIYAYDTGMAEAVKFQVFSDEARLIENSVALELKRRNQTFYSYLTKQGWEVDFIIKQGHQTSELIQVSYDVQDPKTKDREMRALLAASDELQCKKLSILTWSTKGEEKREGKKISLVPLAEWLLDKNNF